jgi:hypothetical protein
VWQGWSCYGSCPAVPNWQLITATPEADWTQRESGERRRGCGRFNGGGRLRSCEGIQMITYV